LLEIPSHYFFESLLGNIVPLLRLHQIGIVQTNFNSPRDFEYLFKKFPFCSFYSSLNLKIK
jgi:hypothetical protein